MRWGSDNKIVNNTQAPAVFNPAGGNCSGQPSFETDETGDCGGGLHLIGVWDSTIADNKITLNDDGILVSDETAASHDILIRHNSVINNPGECGIVLASHPPVGAVGSKHHHGWVTFTDLGQHVLFTVQRQRAAGVREFAGGRPERPTRQLHDSRFQVQEAPNRTSEKPPPPTEAAFLLQCFNSAERWLQKEIPCTCHAAVVLSQSCGENATA